jgi:diguanylate cyclase (GGDEF)-like protein
VARATLGYSRAVIPIGDEERVHPLLASYREKLYYAFAVAGVLTLLPVAIETYSQGRYALAGATTVVAILFVVNAVALAGHRSPPIPLLLIALPSIAAIAIAVYGQSLFGILCAYPAALMFQFMFAQRTANIVNAVLLVLVVAFAGAWIGGLPTLAVAVTLGLTMMFSNIFASFAHRLRTELEEQAITDPLTGAYNRRELDRHLDEAVERRKRHGVTATLLALDLDHFKTINDRFGHAVGDLVLRNVVMAIEQRVRRLDVLFRTGGEEFLVLLPHPPLSRAALVAESLRTTIAGAAAHGDRRITASIGVAEVAPTDDRESWLRRGDQALYQAKEAGRDRVEVAEAPPAPTPAP